MPRRTIAIGDIHGHAAALRSLLEAIGPGGDDLLVPLGDFVDRGPQSRETLEELVRLSRHASVVPLLGNHEEMMLSAVEGIAVDFWLCCGGRQTLESYGGDLEAIPDEHLDLLRRSRLYLETSRHILLHAGYDPALPMEAQRRCQLLWQHLPDPPPAPHVSGKTVVCGHTPQRSGEVLDLGHLVCIDTFIFGGGRLTALDLQSGEIWQVDRDGCRCR